LPGADNRRENYRILIDAARPVHYTGILSRLKNLMIPKKRGTGLFIYRDPEQQRNPFENIFLMNSG